MKFYKDSSNRYWLNEVLTPSGNYCLNTDSLNVTIWKIDTKETVYNGIVSGLLKENGSSYSSLVELLTAVGGFFNTSVDFTELITAVQGSGGTTLKSFEVEITRPANQTPYSAGDVIADTTAAFKPFTNVAKAIGTGVKIIRVRIQTEDTSVAGLKFNVHLYKEAPTFIADNAAFAISYANASKRIGAIPVVMGTGNLGTVGMNDYNQMITNPTARDIYFIIETVSAFTASANSTKFKVVIDCELSNN